MPSCIKRSVQQQNIRFLHTRSQYTEDYFKFIRNIASINLPTVVISNDLQQTQMVCKEKNIQLFIINKFTYLLLLK